MATYTQADHDAVKAAILALASGTRVISLTFGSRTVQYQQAQSADLVKLLALIDADLATSAGAAGQTYRLAATSKGV